MPNGMGIIITVSSLWITVLKWVGVAAAIVALIGVPIWYINHRIDLAFQQGVLVGTEQCEQRHTAAAGAQIVEAQLTMNQERERADALEHTKAELQKNLTNTQVKLNEALNKTTLPVGCIVNSAATSLLRAAAGGDFSLSRTPVPGQLDPKVQLAPSLPYEGGVRHSGLSTGVHSSG